MDAVDLIKAFEGETKLPVDVNDVLAVLRGNGHDDDIEFIGVDLDPDILQGGIRIFHVRDGVYSDPRRCVNIYYNRNSSKDWQRIVCCKELLHIMDPAAANSGTPEAIEKLAKEIGLPPEMQDPVTEGLGTNLDRLAEWRAVAILFPMTARNVLRPFCPSSLKLPDIARQADIPSRYAGLAMHDIWDQVYPILCTRPIDVPAR